MKFHFLSSDTEDAQSAFQVLTGLYPQNDIENADFIIALGGDGTVLTALHALPQHCNPAVFAFNRGSVGFLTNPYHERDVYTLPQRLQAAQRVDIHPLSMVATDLSGKRWEGLAYNEVSLLRQTRQAAKIRISIDGIERLPELVCDGALVSTPAGSTAYNLSAHGPIIPLGTTLLALTPMSAFRPRRWKGALLPDHSKICFDILESDKRPVSATADDFEVRNVHSVLVQQSEKTTRTLLFDPDHTLDERILKEQFLP